MAMLNFQSKTSPDLGYGLLATTSALAAQDAITSGSPVLGLAATAGAVLSTALKADNLFHRRPIVISEATDPSDKFILDQHEAGFPLGTTFFTDAKYDHAWYRNTPKTLLDKARAVVAFNKADLVYAASTVTAAASAYLGLEHLVGIDSGGIWVGAAGLIGTLMAGDLAHYLLRLTDYNSPSTQDHFQSKEDAQGYIDSRKIEISVAEAKLRSDEIYAFVDLLAKEEFSGFIDEINSQSKPRSEVIEAARIRLDDLFLNDSAVSSKRLIEVVTEYKDSLTGDISDEDLVAATKAFFIKFLEIATPREIMALALAVREREAFIPNRTEPVE